MPKKVRNIIVDEPKTIKEFVFQRLSDEFDQNMLRDF
jgi:hypothetical protein